MHRSVHSSHYSHDSSRTKDPVDPQEAERRRRDADREFERNRDRERDRSRERRYRGSSRDYHQDRSDRRRRGGDYPPHDDDERDDPRAHKRRRSSSRDDPRPSSRHYDDYYYADRGHRDGGGARRDRGRDRDYDRRPPRREPSYEPCVAARETLFAGTSTDFSATPSCSPRSRRSPSYEPPRMARSPSPQCVSPQRSNLPKRLLTRPTLPQRRLSEEQREMRSVFVSQLAARVTDRELGIFFEKLAGKVRDARVIVDRITRRSKG